MMFPRVNKILSALIVAALLNIQYAYCENILGLIGMPSMSHHIWSRPLFMELAQQGHNVTILGTHVEKEKIPNVHFIQMEGLYEKLREYFESNDISEMAENNPLVNIRQAYDRFEGICKIMISSNGFKTLKNYPDDFRFDVILHDFTSGQCLLGFVHKFKNPPLISMTALNIPSYTPFISGNPQFPAYVPLMPLPYASEMTFCQRSMNLFCHLYDRFMRYYIYMPSINEMTSKYFGEDLPDLTILERSTVLTFVNTDPSIDIAQPLLPNVIEIGGIHIQAPNNSKISGKLKDILNEEKGIIFFSLGSNIRSDLITPDKIQMFWDAFSKFPEYNILWKYENENLTNIPHNVFIQKWMPQNEILSSPNIKLFITHAGMLSTQEAVFHGVPMLGMPFFIDQHQNLHKSIIAGVAEKIDYNNLSAEIIVEKISQVLNNNSYQINVKRRQAAFRNKQNGPLKTALFWVNYVIYNRGESNFETLLVQMPLWKLLLLDVIVAFIITSILICITIQKLLIELYKLIRSITN